MPPCHGGYPIGDRFGPRRTLAVACVLTGIAGAARGLSRGFASLAVTTLITGLAQWAIPMNIHKTCGVWFPKEKLGMANVFSPPIGNWLERFGPGAPFLFWASVVGVSLLCYLFVQRTGGKF